MAEWTCLASHKNLVAGAPAEALLAVANRSVVGAVRRVGEVAPWPPAIWTHPTLEASMYQWSACCDAASLPLDPLQATRRDEHHAMVHLLQGESMDPAWPQKTHRVSKDFRRDSGQLSGRPAVDQHHPSRGLVPSEPQKDVTAMAACI